MAMSDQSIHSAKYSQYLNATINVLENAKSLDSLVDRSLGILESSLKEGGTLYFCGNGGSAADSQHWAAEFVGRFRVNGLPIAAVSLTTNTSVITAIANDFGYDEVFSRQIQATGKTNDVLFAISTSGNSESIVKAAKVSKLMGIKVISFTGQTESELTKISDITFNVPSLQTEIIQHVHITLGHFLAGELEKNLRVRG